MSLFGDQLKRLDKTLFVKRDNTIGRFVIYRRDRKNFPRTILVVEDADGQFCYPNYNHIAKLYQMDSWSNKNLINDIDKHNDNLDREGDEKIHHLSDEMSKIATRTRYY